MKTTAFIFLVKTVVQHHYIRMTPTIFAQGTLFHLGQDVPNTFRMRDEIRKKYLKEVVFSLENPVMAMLPPWNAWWAPRPYKPLHRGNNEISYAKLCLWRDLLRISCLTGWKMSSSWVICRNSAVSGLSLFSVYCKKSKFPSSSESFTSVSELDEPGLYFTSSMSTFWCKVSVTNVVIPVILWARNRWTERTVLYQFQRGETHEEP